jgi:chromosome segregation ATPase
MSGNRLTIARAERRIRAITVVAALLVGVLLVVAAGCQIGTRRPLREQTRPYDLVPQSGYLADGPTVAADYAVPAPTETSEAAFDEATYRAAIQKDLVRINALLTENERLRQELAATTAALEEATDNIEQLMRRIDERGEKLERAEARAARRDSAKASGE